MRLLRTDSGLLEEKNEYVEDFKYAILSHTWLRQSEGEEVLFADLTDMTKARQKAGWKKLEFAIAQAAKEGLQYVWIDTCCINKESSAELAEAINSMYRWYQKSEICYVYLDDYQDSASMGDCRWFKRGWTLQEMIASPNLLFFDESGESIGHLSDLIQQVSAITGVHQDLLSGQRSLSTFSIAQKMFWAANRETARIEDRAYSLLGIFDISLPVIYGEGSRAFQRLQEELIRVYNDQSIFAWGLADAARPHSPHRKDRSLLAPSPDAFAAAVHSKLAVVRGQGYQKQCEVLGRNIRFNLPLFDMPRWDGIGKDYTHYAVLNCYIEDSPNQCVSMELFSAGYGDLVRESAGYCDIVDASQRCTSWPFTVLRNFDNAGMHIEDYVQQTKGPMLLIRSCANDPSIGIDSGEGTVVLDSSPPRIILRDAWDAGQKLFRFPVCTNPLSPEQPSQGRLSLPSYLDGAVTITLDGVACVKVNICVFPESLPDGSFAFTKQSRFDLRYEALLGSAGFSFRVPMSSRRFYFLLMRRKFKILITGVNRHRPLLQNEDRFQLIEFSCSSRKGTSSLLSSLLAVPPLIIYSLLVWPFWWFFPFFHEFRVWWRLFLVTGIVATTVSITVLILDDDTKANKGTYGVVMAFIDGVLGLLLFLSLYPRIKPMLEKI
ncbi:Vegetative incompatibility protein HET-E-1 [Cercospora beticola]|uniref:Vegetative incompatibility protein HET-E-1 n=1 Tax=Cercospora beticola TaxID=122368 RepID=A0A2G5HK87_CERBT|nr:Vegetative incompatibility protein HET-E-1 [Cercospora beticola]PIA92964.1 Vegetative incompatibility protein HET-E-1 [Cercospora beticola]WPB01823.1 hypothetical protein RHO25_006455 [Cercospora beticola]CAK1363344.1 unnamed protein product [Cercospora beticola]